MIRLIRTNFFTAGKTKKVIIKKNCLFLVHFLPCIIVLKDDYITVSKQLHLPFETTRLAGSFVKLRPIYKFRADNSQFA